MTRAGTDAFVGLGANLDDPLRQVTQALVELDAIAHTRVLGASSFYRTAPVGYAEQPDFINAVARVHTSLTPRKLLEALHAIEAAHARRRSVRNAPRTLDLDLLLYGALSVREQGLIVPHPRLHERAFVLVPLAELAPEVRVPGLGTAAQLAAQADRSGVEKLDAA